VRLRRGRAPEQRDRLNHWRDVFLNGRPWLSDRKGRTNWAMEQVLERFRAPSP
jgi:hypothetical protein